MILAMGDKEHVYWPWKLKEAKLYYIEKGLKQKEEKFEFAFWNKKNTVNKVGGWSFGNQTKLKVGGIWIAKS